MVDDETDLRLALSLVLKKEGIRCGSGRRPNRPGFGGKEAFDMVVCDVRMPNQTGCSFSARSAG